MYCLCDCNNFFASCERVFNPSLNNRPVIVLSNNDGCVIARSNEAKSLGIKMGQPLFQLTELIKRANVAVFSSNYQLYGDMSDRVMQMLRKAAPSLEIYSIDEAFLNLTGLPTDQLLPFCKELGKTIKRGSGIPVSLGIAPTKTLAKVAGHLCKEYPKLQGVCLMHRSEDITKVLSTLPIEEVWGVGRQHSKMLKSNGVHTAEAFRQLPEQWVKRQMSITGVRTWKELWGEESIAFEHQMSDKQSIMVSRSFASELTQFSDLYQSLATFTAMAAEKLRKQHSVCNQMVVFIHTNRFKEEQPQQRDSLLIHFQEATNSTLEMQEMTHRALKGLFKEGYGYKRAGVILQAIQPQTGVQTSLFDKIDRGKHQALMQAVDRINTKNTQATVLIGAQERGFRSNRNYLSPRYTTEWSELLEIIV